MVAASEANGTWRLWAVARILDREPETARNRSVYLKSFEVNMSTWLDGYKHFVGAEGWTVTNIDSKDLIARSEAQFAAGRFQDGYMGLALAVCTGPGFQNRFSEVADLANEELGLPEEDLLEVVQEGLETPNPFA